MKTQVDRVLQLLKESSHMGMSVKELEYEGIRRVPARIYELRKKGYIIERSEEIVGDKITSRYVYAGEIERG